VVVLMKLTGSRGGRRRPHNTHSPVEAIETAAERKREHAEERDGEPEEVQCRRIARTPQPDGATHEQGENPDRGQDEVQCSRTSWNGSQPDVDDFAGAEPERGVAERVVASRRVQDRDHLCDVLHRPIVDGQQEIASANTDGRRWRARRNLGGDDTLRVLFPENSVFDLVPRCTGRNVRGAQAQESRNHDHRECGPRPPAPDHSEPHGNPMIRTCHPIKWSQKQRQKLGSICSPR
jgi:hypothetical protein